MGLRRWNDADQKPRSAQAVNPGQRLPVGISVEELVQTDCGHLAAERK
jgi:LysM repeat protein